MTCIGGAGLAFSILTNSFSTLSFIKRFNIYVQQIANPTNLECSFLTYVGSINKENIVSLDVIAGLDLLPSQQFIQGISISHSVIWTGIICISNYQTIKSHIKISIYHECIKPYIIARRALNSVQFAKDQEMRHYKPSQDQSIKEKKKRGVKRCLNLTNLKLREQK